MNSLVVYLMLLLCTLNISVHCTYHLTIKDNIVPLPPHQYTTSTIVYNDVIYAYGGNIQYGDFAGTDKLFSYTLNSSTGEMVVNLEDERNGPICTFCNAVLFPDSHEILVLARPNYDKNSTLFHNQTMNQENQTVLPHFYDLEKRTWRVGPSPQMIGQVDAFYFRQYSTTVMNGNDGVYIMGGYKIIKENDDQSYRNYGDGWYYNRYENSYTTISLPGNKPYIDAIGYIDLDGNLALLGGCNQSRGTTGETCYHITELNIYNNFTKTWSTKEVTLTPDKKPTSLSASATQVDYTRKLLYVSGGRFKGDPFPNFMMLDLEKSMWITGIPDGKSENQIPHYYSSGSLIMNNSYFVRIFGLSSALNKDTEMNTVDILNLTFSTSFTNQTHVNQTQPIKWITSILEDNNTSSKNRKYLYIGLACGLIVALAVALFLFFKRRSLPKYWHGIRRALLWNPRKGEPASTEVSRLFMRIVSLAILVAFLVFNINDVLTSTTSTSSSIHTVPLITVPDFRLCFADWYKGPSNKFNPTCKFIGDRPDATCELKPIGNHYYVPHYPSQSSLAITCFMYAPDEPMQVASGNASLVVTTFGNVYTGEEAVYMQLYQRDKNMNRLIFNNEPLNGTTQSDILSWSLNETLSGLQVHALPDSYTTIEYQETDYKKIRNDSAWNYFGANPDYLEYTELSIHASQPVIRDNVAQNKTSYRFHSSFTLTATGFEKTTNTEKRDSTILHVFGSIGGIISLLLALQVILFGTRPSSPWGIFHYWTWKKKNTPPDLGEQFRIEEAQVPFINPVHQRFNNVFKKNSDDNDMINTSSSSNTPLIDKENMEERISRLEARNQLLELVMKNYYLDPQVFHALGYSQRSPEEDDQSERNKLNNQNSDHEDSDREPEYEKVSFQSDNPILQPNPTLYSKKK